MIRPLPKRLAKLVIDHPDKIEEGWTEQDSFSHDGSWSHWLYLKPGWCAGDWSLHLIHEPTVKEVLEAYKAIAPCDCEDCQEREVSIMVAKVIPGYVRVPKVFYDDHTEGRDLPAPPVMHETERHYWLERGHPDMAELVNDAEFYADVDGPDACPPGLKGAAKALLRALLDHTPY